MGRDPGPNVNHVVSAITIEEFHHEHFPMVSSYQGLSPMQAEFLELVPEQLNVSHRSSAEIHTESITSIWSATPVSPHTTQEQFWPTDVISRLEVLEPTTATTTFGPEDESVCALALVKRLNELEEPSGPVSPKSAITEIPMHLMPIDQSEIESLASAVSCPTDISSHFSSSTLETLSSAVYANPFNFKTDNAHIHPFVVNHGDEAMELDNEENVDFVTYELVKTVDEEIVGIADEDFDMIINESANMIADQNVDTGSDGNQISKVDKPMIDTAVVYAPIATAAAIFAKDDSPRPSKAKTAVELIVEEQDSSVEERAPSIDTLVPTVDESNLIVGKPAGRVDQPTPIVVKRAPSIDKLAQSLHKCISSVEQHAFTADKRASSFDKCTSNVGERASVGPVSVWRRSTIRLKELGKKILKPELQEQLIVTVSSDSPILYLSC